jgi:hypothetical protein
MIKKYAIFMALIIKCKNGNVSIGTFSRFLLSIACFSDMAPGAFYAFKYLLADIARQNSTKAACTCHANV